jgi:hypothetical protein
MASLVGAGGELRATVQIARKATGRVETVEIVSRTTPEQHAQIMRDEKMKAFLGIKENDDGNNA